MKIQEAIEKLKYLISGDCTDNQMDFVEEIEMAINALEKQMPKKPAYEGDGYDDSGNLIYDTWICPHCGNRYELDYEIHTHCPMCGQVIDWNEAEGDAVWEYHLIHAMDKDDLIVIGDYNAPCDKMALYNGTVRGIKKDNPVNKMHVSSMCADNDVILVLAQQQRSRQ